MKEKEFDFLATMFLNPESSISGFVEDGMSVDNAIMHDKEYYRSKAPIINKFSNEDGVFDEAKFNDYYDRTLNLYNNFNNNELVSKNMLDNN